MKILTVLSLAFLAIFFGCQTSSTTSPEVTGDLKGIVSLIDSHGNLVNDKSGVLVQAEGTSLSGISDTGGNWIIHNLPTRTYSISFSKAGYGTMKNTSYSFVGGGTVLYNPNIYLFLYQPVTFTLSLDSVLAPSGKNTFDPNDRRLLTGRYGSIFGHINGANLDDSSRIAYATRIFIGTSPNIDYLDQSTYHSVESNLSPFFTKIGVNLVFGLTGWFDGETPLWIKSGDTIYVKVYSLMNTNSYTDVNTGKDVIVNPPPSSNVLSAIVP